MKSRRALPWVHLKQGSFDSHMAKKEECQSLCAYCRSAEYKILIPNLKGPLQITDHLPVVHNLQQMLKMFQHCEFP